MIGRSAHVKPVVGMPSAYTFARRVLVETVVGSPYVSMAAIAKIATNATTIAVQLLDVR